MSKKEQREYIRPWLGLRLSAEINVTSNPLLACAAQTERPLSSYHQLHTHTQPLSPARSRTISFMEAQSLWNVTLPGKLAIISQRLQLSQLYSIGKRGKEQERKRRAREPGQWIHEFIKGEGRGVSGERGRGGSERKRGRDGERSSRLSTLC